jgi:hypothetical protein
MELAVAISTQHDKLGTPDKLLNGDIPCNTSAVLAHGTQESQLPQAFHSFAFQISSAAYWNRCSLLKW